MASRDDSTTHWAGRDKIAWQGRAGEVVCSDKCRSDFGGGVPELWAGTDAGKTEHHGVVIDADGKRKLSRRVATDETVLLQLIAYVLALSEH
ncbi:MAG: hypothetical protein JF597_32890 [Streptomyces sp.]|uniref:IS110 family transposase n=1 Tax=Streptomyces sp. TaxID=1931 RepID=UPI0025EE5B6A|nr:transposase [Streptomyces sp.]MBW8798210.1 hypothetical protein [Streptomyces sp.]